VVDSFLKWVGGKSRLREEIIPLIPAHKTYVEPFGGACWVLFGKPPSPVEVINDMDGLLIDLYRMVRDNLEEFLEAADRLPISEELFTSWSLGHSSMDPRGIPGLGDRNISEMSLDDLSGMPIAAAVRTYYLVMNSFHSRMSGQPCFSVSPGKEASFVRYYSTDWDRVRERLKRVTILSRDFRAVLEATDSKNTFYYLDPPYLCATDNARYYRCTFSEEDHQALRDVLLGTEGRFLLSYQDDPRIREMYQWDFNIISSALVPGEIYILNYTPPNPPFYGVCSTRIPKVPDDGECPVSRRAPYTMPNCPECGSRKVQQWYKRVTYEDKRRSYNPSDRWGKAYGCNSCGTLFRAPPGIPEGDHKQATAGVNV